MNFIKIFSGSEIMVQAIQEALKVEEISSVVKNNIQSAVMAGFGTAGQAVDIFVDKKDVMQAKLIIDKIVS
ncbi:putative signal transducing protein [Flavobacterium sp. H122]|uniref:putative signal transducing protein n=1 Tax=Flavobacterium sp. H122 TaxID=2529860 RepID=UPI0010AB123A|nr:DUF2007 domain-containing protein [Flavobacterium sp. H122]